MTDEKLKNNLFSYATSELSQDAFICWLCSYALEESTSDPVLKACAKKLISVFVPELHSKEFVLQKIEQQQYHIDVLLTVKTEHETYKVIVEDKTYTREHGGQLTDYVSAVKRNFHQCEVRGVYYKTGYQSDLSAVKEAGYHIVTREQMLNVLRPFVPDANSQILSDYYEYWDDFQKKTEEYTEKEVAEWDWHQVNGCFGALKEELCRIYPEIGIGYGYLSNPDGGFYGFWAALPDDTVSVCGISCKIYLQLHVFTKEPTTVQLCLKISAKEETTDKNVLRSIRNAVMYDDQGTYKQEKYHFHKPRRSGNGRHMTIGIYDGEFPDFQSMQNVMQMAIEDYRKLLQIL